jgi:hypothetical protein
MALQIVTLEADPTYAKFNAKFGFAAKRSANAALDPANKAVSLTDIHETSRDRPKVAPELAAANKPAAGSLHTTLHSTSSSFSVDHKVFGKL